MITLERVLFGIIATVFEIKSILRTITMRRRTISWTVVTAPLIHCRISIIRRDSHTTTAGVVVIITGCFSCRRRTWCCCCCSCCSCCSCWCRTTLCCGWISGIWWVKPDVCAVVKLLLFSISKPTSGVVTSPTVTYNRQGGGVLDLCTKTYTFPLEDVPTYIVCASISVRGLLCFCL